MNVATATRFARQLALPEVGPAGQERASCLIHSAFGTNPTITFKTDPTLIAGLELHGPHLAVSNSWRADLQKILADLTHGS